MQRVCGRDVAFVFAERSVQYHKHQSIGNHLDRLHDVKDMFTEIELS